jgi:hypothetical protein
VDRSKAYLSTPDSASILIPASPGTGSRCRSR